MSDRSRNRKAYLRSLIRNAETQKTDTKKCSASFSETAPMTILQKVMLAFLVVQQQAIQEAQRQACAQKFCDRTVHT